MLATSDAVAGPSPLGARPLAAEDVHLCRALGHRASDTADCQVRDGNTSRRSTGRATVLVVLLDDNTILGDVGQGDTLVLDIRNRARRVVHRLDAHAIVRVGDGAVENAHRLDRVVGPAADGADREAVAAAARAACEGDVGARVDGQAVVLVLDDGARNVDAGRRADVEGVGVVAAAGVTGRVVDDNVVTGVLVRI